jgi:hypothetical protein
LFRRAIVTDFIHSRAVRPDRLSYPAKLETLATAANVAPPPPGLSTSGVREVTKLPLAKVLVLADRLRRVTSQTEYRTRANLTPGQPHAGLNQYLVRKRMSRGAMRDDVDTGCRGYCAGREVGGCAGSWHCVEDIFTS